MAMAGGPSASPHHSIARASLPRRHRRRGRKGQIHAQVRSAKGKGARLAMAPVPSRKGGGRMPDCQQAGARSKRRTITPNQHHPQQPSQPQQRHHHPPNNNQPPWLTRTISSPKASRSTPRMSAMTASTSRRSTSTSPPPCRPKAVDLSPRRHRPSTPSRPRPRCRSWA